MSSLESAKSSSIWPNTYNNDVSFPLLTGVELENNYVFGKISAVGGMVFCSCDSSVSTSEMVTPRLNRWSSKLTISATQCSKLQVKLSKPDNVRRAFVYISVEEQDLLGGEGETDSTDFEEEENRRVDWKRHSSWPKEMPRIRAEIVAALLQTFQASLLISNGYSLS
ncbi:hypothetical protein KSP40_PGU010026 [Platanthera guangdongensis]|uniref:Uncharacterized protein n=1 Tax=Platanthera guangdongensis TaxID=2320717 RepID=A0ABR2M2M5_9ASPA